MSPKNTENIRLIDLTFKFVIQSLNLLPHKMTKKQHKITLHGELKYIT